LFSKNFNFLAEPQIYLGQRVWRKDGLSSEWNQQVEMISMFAQQYRQCQIDHCIEITRTLNKANAEFKNCGYSRFRIGISKKTNKIGRGFFLEITFHGKIYLWI
jgi:hypothetical protein